MDGLIHLDFNRYSLPNGVILRRIVIENEVFWINPDNPIKLFKTIEEAIEHKIEIAIF